MCNSNNQIAISSSNMFAERQMHHDSIQSGKQTSLIPFALVAVAVAVAVTISC
jgi:hypothetical protein